MQFLLSTIPKTIIKAMLGLIYPPVCPICGKGIASAEGNPLCQACHKEIKHDPGYFTAETKQSEHYFDSVYSAVTYDGIMRKCIHKFKYSGDLSLETLFGGLINNLTEKSFDARQFDYVVPVPLHRTKLRERSFNQAAILALNFSRKFKIPCSSDNLIRQKPGKPQTCLSKKNRMEDIRGAFILKRPDLLKNRSILLVDDVFTTGATVNECSKVLKKAGVKYIAVLTLAKGARHQ